MAEVRRFLFVRHLRADAVSYIIKYRHAKVVRSGVGLATWFNAMSDSIAEVPTEDRDLSLIVHARTADFQDITVQGVLTYRAASPERLAQRIDFSVDLATGSWRTQPLEKVGLMLSQLAQEFAINHITRTSVRELLAGGVTPVREAIDQGLRGTSTLEDMGLELVTVRIGSVKPFADLEKAIEAPTRESIKQEADHAAYQRRAMAVENERAIGENEMHNKIELAKREERLLEQQGANARRTAQDAAAAAKIASDSQAERLRIVHGAQAELERQRIDYLRDIQPSVLMALAAGDLARKIRKMEHVNVTPDVLTLLARAVGSPNA